MFVLDIDCHDARTIGIDRIDEADRTASELHVCRTSVNRYVKQFGPAFGHRRLVASLNRHGREPDDVGVASMQTPILAGRWPQPIAFLPTLAWNSIDRCEHAGEIAR